MPRFFYDFRDERGELDRDDIGVDLADFESAYLEGHRAAIDIWAEQRRNGRKPDVRSVEIRDASDTILLELPFSEALGIGDDAIQAFRPKLANLPFKEVEPGEADLNARINRCIADQRARVERLERKGLDTTLAKSLLATFLRTQALRDEYRNLIRRRPS